MTKFLTTKQLQELLKIDRITVYRMVNDGRLKGVKFGNQWRFAQDEVDRLLGNESPKAKEPETETPLTDFPVDCVQKLQEIFAGILSIGAVTVNLKGEPLTEVHYANPFCKLMMANAKGCEACKASWRRAALRANGEPPYMVCHAGLSYLRTVIQMNDRSVAVLIAGQFHLNPPDPEREAIRLEDLAIRYQIPLAELQEAASKIPVLKRGQQELVQEWAPKVAMTVQSMLCERSDLMARLQRIASLSSVRSTLPKLPNP
jgi:excisionase family DNA binding protein